MSAIPPLPPSVKVGYQRYRIVEWDKRAAMAADRFGECSHCESEIRIWLVAGWVKGANTLLHEILHAVWVAQSLSDADGEERYVGAFADGLSGVWVDNPDVIAWINAGLNSGDH